MGSMRTLSILLLVGCAAPTDGTYAVTITQTESSCPANFYPNAEPNESIEIDVNQGQTAVTLVLVVDELCSLDGLAFDCPYTSEDEVADYNADGIAAIYTTEAGIRGEWTDSDHLTAVTGLSSSCDGDGCTELAEAGKPDCTVAWYWEGERAPE